MNIKIQCSCGTKFSFDVEPVDGRMPVNVFCPKCGTDVTDAANGIIQNSGSAETVSASAPTAEKPKMRLQVSKHAAAEGSASAAVTAAPGVEMCSRHPRNVATEHCVVCGKPICPECMESYGFLCSVNCRYRAEQEKIRVPVYKMQRSLVGKKQTQKTLAITGAVCVLIAALIGAWFWYIFAGSKPRPFYSLKLAADKQGAFARFLGPNRIFLLTRKEASVHDIKSKKDAWTTALQDPKPAPEPVVTKPPGKKTFQSGGDENPDFDSGDDFSSVSATPFFSGDAAWICLAHNVVCLDLKNGNIKYTIPFRGRLDAFTPGESTLLVVSDKSANKKLLTQISTASGEVKTAEAESSLREKLPASKELPSNVLPTAALLLKMELEGEEMHHPSIYKFSSEFFPAGQNLVEMQVKLIEPKVENVQTMKAPGPSHLDQNTSASTSARSVAEEIFNEQKRAATGGFRRVDVSRYGVLLRRTMEEGAKDWTGEVVGTPVFFPAKTVDILVAGTNLLFFDKQNKKIAETQLSYPLDDRFTSGMNQSGTSPCVETNGTLYLFDKGVLTAFDLPACSVRWRLTSVGVSALQFDEKGMLYVNTTTAAPEDIQYSDEIKINDATRPIVLKVDPKSGKTLWKSEQYGDGCYLTGKYVYMTDASRVGFSMITATEDAFGVAPRRSGNLNLYRIDPANGKRLWDFHKKGAPQNIDFSQNRILVEYGDEIEILKFISF